MSIKDLVLQYDNVRPENESSFNEVIRGFDNHCVSDNIYNCPVCLGLPRKPVSLRECGHIGCLPCMRTVLSLHPQPSGLHVFYGACPICRAQFFKRDITEFAHWPLVLKQFWRYLRVQCEWPKCEYIGDPEDVKCHERFCSRRDFACPSYRCFTRGNLDTMVQHADECEFLFVHCPECRYPVRNISRGKHNCENAMKNADKIRKKMGNLLGNPGGISLKEIDIDEFLAEQGTEFQWPRSGQTTILSVSNPRSPSVSELVANAEIALQALSTPPPPPQPTTPPPPPPPPATPSTSQFETPTLATISQARNRPRGVRSRPYEPGSNQGARNLINNSVRRNIFE
jgi:Zinc finger, C3HC4 type (RING finger)